MGRRDTGRFQHANLLTDFYTTEALEICNRNENFVPLQCQMKVVETAGIKVKNCGN